MLNIPEYKEYAGETKIALMDNSSLAFMHELSQRSYPSDGILSVYDLILIPKWVMEEIEDSTYRSTYVEQLQAQGYPIRWIDETKYGAFVNDEDVNLYYIVEAAVSRVSELMRFLRRKVKTEDLIDLPSAEEWMNRLYDEWPIHGRTLSTGRTLKKNAGEISLTILAEIFAWYHDGVDSLTIYTQDHCSAWFFYLLGSVLLATAVLSFLMQQSQGMEALQMLVGGFVIFMIPQVVGSMVVLLELVAVMLRQVWYI